MCGKEFVFLVLAAPPKPFPVSNLLNKLQSIDPNEPVKPPISRDADSAERKVHWKWKWNVVSLIFLLCHKSTRHEIITSTMVFYTSPCTQRYLTQPNSITPIHGATSISDCYFQVEFQQLPKSVFIQSNC